MKTEQGTISNPVATSDTAFFDREIGWLRIDARKTRWIALATFFLCLLDMAVIARFASGPINVFHNDALILLDDGWRVFNGQVPHRDFYSPLGPLEYGIMGLGMLLSRGGPQAIALGTAIFGFAVGLWGWLLSRRRMPPLFGLMIAAWLILTSTAPTPLGFDNRFLSCAMIYNRQGYALLGLILLECAFARRDPRFWGGASSGAALILLGFLKLNFFGVAGLLLLVSLPLCRVELPRLWGFATGAGATLLAFLAYPRFSILAFLSDMAAAIQGRGSSLKLKDAIDAIGKCAQSGGVWMVVAGIIALIYFTSPGRRLRRPTATFTLLSLVVLASGPFFVQTNALESGCQLATLWLIIMLERLSAIHLKRNEGKILTLALVAMGVGGIAAGVLPDVAGTFSLLQYQSAQMKASGLTIAAPGMERLRFYNTNSFYDQETKGGDGDGTYAAECLNDGVELLSSHSQPGESVVSLGFYNPFSYLLRRKPAQGSSFLLVGNSISQAHMPDPGRVFDHADLIMLPDYQGTHRASDLYLQDYYRAYLLQHFHFVAKSQYWSLYRRNP
jgi:hypothetical protein